MYVHFQTFCLGAAFLCCLHMYLMSSYKFELVFKPVTITNTTKNLDYQTK
jgi:hypothetical protein